MHTKTVPSPQPSNWFQTMTISTWHLFEHKDRNKIPSEPIRHKGRLTGSCKRVFSLVRDVHSFSEHGDLHIQRLDKRVLPQYKDNFGSKYITQLRLAYKLGKFVVSWTEGLKVGKELWVNFLLVIAAKSWVAQADSLFLIPMSKPISSKKNRSTMFGLTN